MVQKVILLVALPMEANVTLKETILNHTGPKMPSAGRMMASYTP